MLTPDEQRALLRNQTCVETSAQIAPIAAPVRPTPPCEPAPLVAPEIFTKPAPAPPQAAPVLLAPTTAILLSPAISANCADVPGLGPIGAPVSVVEGLHSLSLYWTQIPGVQPDQLDYIARLSDEDMRNVLQGTLSVVASLTLLTPAQSSWLSAQILSLRATLLQLAIASAQAGLLCVWNSAQQDLACAAGALTTGTGPGGLAVPLNPVLVPAGQFTSTVGQADADNQAAAFARSTLVCWWGNTAQTVWCDDPLLGTQTAEVPSFTIAAGTIFSASSQADADAQALAAAQARLVCVYANAAQVADCPLDNTGAAASWAVVNDTLVRVSPADPATGTTGNTATVPAAFLTSTVSLAAANTQALALAQSLLDCYWLNTQQQAFCPVGSDGAPLDPTTSPSVTVLAGFITSYTGQADADALALSLATQQLVCRYCNAAVAPACVPVRTYTPGDKLPLAIPTDPLVFAKWSLDATLGVAAGTFCGADPAGVASVINSVASIPVSTLATSADCQYGNDAQTFACAMLDEQNDPTASNYVDVLFPQSTNVSDWFALDPASYPTPPTQTAEGQTFTVAADAFIIGEKEVPQAWTDSGKTPKDYANLLAKNSGLASLNCFFRSDARTFECPAGVAAASTGAPDSVVVIAAGTFSSPLSKAEANAARDALGAASLNCFYASAEVVRYCPQYCGLAAQDASGSLQSCAVPAIPSSISHLSKGYKHQRVALGLPGYSNHPDNAVHIAAGAYTAPASGAGKDADQKTADDQAVAAATALLDCFFTNSEKKAHCALDADNVPADAIPGSVVTIAADVFRSYLGQEDADTTALDMANGQVSCRWSNDAITVTCGDSSASGAGSTGPVAMTYPSNSIKIDAAVFTSATRKAEANFAAKSAAFGQLGCQFGNSGGVGPSIPCGRGQVGFAVAIAANTVFGGTQAEADTTAGILANMSQQCTQDTTPVNGRNGKQTNCQGPCFGYYS